MTQRTILVAERHGKVQIAIISGDRVDDVMGGKPLDPQELQDGGISLDPEQALGLIPLIREAATRCGISQA